MTEELNPRFSFDSLVVGAANRLAATAARTVAESPGTTYNPLFVYGSTGLGKTHLLMAVGQHAKQLNAELNLEYLTIDEFVETYHAAVAAGQSEAYRSRLDRLDLLLVDDVQFLTHRRDMQAELLRLIGQLQPAGKQVVLTSDTPPSEIEGLDERLLSRFDGGLVVDIGPPEFETRLAILERRSAEREAHFEAGVLEAVAQFEVPNVRELLGVLNRLVAYQAVSEAPITPEGAKKLLADEIRTEPPMTTGPGPAIKPEGVPPVPLPDEFQDFLSDVEHRVTEQVEAWRSRLEQAVRRWTDEGYDTSRLSDLLESDLPVAVDPLLRQFERDVERLRAAHAAMARIDAQRADDPVFTQPDRADDAEQLVRAALDEVGPPPAPSAAWSMGGFVPGEANSMALNAARAVIEQPGTQYNPLVLVGPTGVGKTHLLHAIGHELQGERDAVVACLSAQQLLDELAEASEAERIEQWRARYRRATAFLLDDAHILAGKERAQEELFYLFNELHGAGRQIGFSLAQAPQEIEGLEDRLKSRMGGGLVATMGGPDRELRRAIAARRLEEQFGAADAELADYLAARPAESVRAVLGLIQRVAGAAEGQGVAPTAALARELIEGAMPARPRVSTPVRTSGVMLSPVSSVRSPEKVVWAWPDPAERVIEELT